jgi:hypothetical protein
MSAPGAIAAVTRTLAGVLEDALRTVDQSCRVTTLPLDKSNQDQQNANRLNLFLIQPTQNAALRNVNANATRRNGAGTQPPLAINLTYMITAYGEATPETKDQRILGKALQVLNEHPVLLRDAIRAHFPGTGLEEQVESVRIKPRDVSLEEMSRLWSAFMTQYRTSAVYDVSVVLIDNDTIEPVGPPVLRRGEGDSGVFAEAGLPPLLTRAIPPELIRHARQVTNQPAVEIGQVLTLEGQRLPFQDAVVTVASLRWGPRQATLVPTAGTAPDTLRVTLGDPPPEEDPPAGQPALAWAPGVYTAALAVRASGRPDIVSNSIPFAVAPKVDISPNAAAPGAVDVTVECSPPPAAGQTVLLLLTGHPPLAPEQITPPAAPGDPTTIKFKPMLDKGEYLAIVRVDGVDSMPYRVRELPEGVSLEFDPAHRITVA